MEGWVDRWVNTAVTYAQNQTQIINSCGDSYTNMFIRRRGWKDGEGWENPCPTGTETFSLLLK